MSMKEKWERGVSDKSDYNYFYQANNILIPDQQNQTGTSQSPLCRQN